MADDFAELSAYLDGELAPAERHAVERRLVRDADYAREYERLKRVHTMMAQCIERPGFHARLMERVQHEEQRLSGSNRFRHYTAMAAAAALLLIAAGVVYTVVAPERRAETAIQPPIAPPPSPGTSGAIVAPAEPVSTDEAKGALPPATQPMETTRLPFKLLGTTTGPAPSAVITVEKDGTSKTDTYGVGDTVIEGVTVTGVEPGKVLLDSHGTPATLSQSTESQGSGINLNGRWLIETMLDGQRYGSAQEAVVIQEGVTMTARAGDAFTAEGTLSGQRLRAIVASAGSDPIPIEGEFNREWTLLQGALPREALDLDPDTPGQLTFQATRVSEEAIASKEVLEQRLKEVRAMWQILRRYSSAHNDTFPKALSELVPMYAENLDAFANNGTRTVNYHPPFSKGFSRKPRLEDIDPSLDTSERLLEWERRLKAEGYDSLAKTYLPLLVVDYKDPAMKIQASITGEVSLYNDPSALSGGSENSAAAEARFATQRAGDQNNLKQLGLVIKMFMNEHWEYTPPGWLSCIPEFLTDPSILTSPKDAPGTDSYLYLFPAHNFEEEEREAVAASDDPNNPAAKPIYESQIPILTNRTEFPGPSAGRNVLYLDGHVAYLRSDYWNESVLPYVNQR